MPQELGQVLMLVARDFQQRLDADLTARGVSGVGARHRAVFLFLARKGPSRAVDLANAAGIRPQSMMKIVHELEELGFVERHADPADSRAKLVGFTGEGRQFIKELSRSSHAVWGEYATVLGEEALRDTIANLKTLTDAGDSIT